MTTPNVKAALEAARRQLDPNESKTETSAATLARINAALSALTAPEVERVRWQCSGCKFAFPGPWQKVCPSCGRSDYWSGSVYPDAPRWTGIATPPPVVEGSDKLATNSGDAAPGGECRTHLSLLPCETCANTRAVLSIGDAPAPSKPSDAPTQEAAGTATSMDFDACARSWFKWAAGRDDDLILRSLTDLVRNAFATGKRAALAAARAELDRVRGYRAAAEEKLNEYVDKVKDADAEIATLRAKLAEMDRAWDADRAVAEDHWREANAQRKRADELAAKLAEAERDSETRRQKWNEETQRADAAEARAKEAEEAVKGLTASCAANAGIAATYERQKKDAERRIAEARKYVCERLMGRTQADLLRILTSGREGGGEMPK